MDVRRLGARADTVVAGLDLGRAAVLTAVVIVVMVLLGIAYHEWGLPSIVDLDGEFTVQSAWSGALLVGAAWAAERVGVRGLTVLFAFMALDEMAGIHEALEKAVGVDWEILYIPIVAAGGLAWLAAVRRTRHGQPLASWLLIAGAAAWFVAQVLEKIQWNGDEHAAGYYPMMYAEEGLEMIGSACFLFGFVLLLRAQIERTKRRQTPLPRPLTRGAPEQPPSRASK